jgi:hypothetical protein
MGGIAMSWGGLSSELILPDLAGASGLSLFLSFE